MNIIEMCEKDQLIMKCLKTSEISHILAKTNKGDLTMKLIFEEKDYKFFLDAVPMEAKENKELIKLFDGVLYETEKEIVKVVTSSEIMEMIAGYAKEVQEKSSKTAREVIMEDILRPMEPVDVEMITTLDDKTAKIIETE